MYLIEWLKEFILKGKIPLKKNIKKTNPFERGQEDVFLIEAEDIGSSIKKIRLDIWRLVNSLDVYLLNIELVTMAVSLARVGILIKLL